MAAAYPSSIAVFSVVIDYSTIVDASLPNQQNAEIVAIQTALGLNAATVEAGPAYTGHSPGTIGYNIDVLYYELANLTSTVSVLSGDTVETVTAANTSIVVSGTVTSVTLKTGTLDVLAVQGPPATDWSNNSKKITSLANGSSAQDAAAYGQIAAALSYYVPLTAFTAEMNVITSSYLALAGGTMSGPIAMGTSKITGLGNGTAAQDAAAFSQIPTTFGTSGSLGVLTRPTTITNVANTYTINTDTTSEALIVSPGAGFTIENPTGTAHDFQRLLIRITEGSAESIAWGSIFASSGIAVLPTITVASKTITLGLIYDFSRTLWVLLALDGVGY